MYGSKHSLELSINANILQIHCEKNTTNTINFNGNLCGSYSKLNDSNIASQSPKEEKQ